MHHATARALSPWFNRTVDALARRHPALAARLPEWCAQPLTPDAVRQLWHTVASACGWPPPAATRATAASPAAALRLARQLINLALLDRDVRHVASLEEICAAQSAWAQCAITVAAQYAAYTLCADFGRPLDANGQAQDLLIIAMGKLGGAELNVSSDVDLVYVHRDQGMTEGGPDGRCLASSEFFHRVARQLGALLSDCTAEGFVFRVDTRLRPHGEAGPLTVTLPMLEQYLYDQGREWERFAWLKAAVIGDTALSDETLRTSDRAALEAIVTPFVYRRYLDFAVFDALRAVHALIRSEAERRDTRRDGRDGGGIDVKLGRGGIREIEFCAQLFQVVRGGREPTLRARNTRATLRTLADLHWIDPATAHALDQAYVLLRRIEHALQFQEDAQTHRLPDDPAAHAHVARMIGLSHADLDAQLAAARAQVMTVFDALLHDPAAAGAPDPEARGLIADEQGAARLQALRQGRRYRLARPETQARIERLIQRALQMGMEMPWARQTLAAAQPATADPIWLGRLLDLLETIAGRPAYLALLDQYPPAYQRVLHLIGQAKWAADYLTQHPVVLDELLDGQILDPLNLTAWAHGLRQTLTRCQIGGAPDLERQMDWLREGHHAQVFRLLAQDLNGCLSVERLSDHLSELAEHMVSIALELAWQPLRSTLRPAPRFAVIAYGRLGGKELGYASDLDLVFIFDDDDSTQPLYTQLAQKICRWLATRTAAGQVFEVDLRLRPHGEAGLPTISLHALTRYQRESAWIWEHQALTRARFVAGDAALGAAFEALRREILATPRATASLANAVCAMREKMRHAHPNRSPEFDLKHDPGGMVDIEFMVQFLVLAHAARHSNLLDNVGNIALLERAGQAGLIPAAAAHECAAAYRTFRRLQHALHLNDARHPRVAPERVATERAAVQALWRQLLPR